MTPMRITRLFSIAAACIVAAACGSNDTGTNPVESGGGPKPIVYTLTIDTTLADTVTATVATQVPVTVYLTKAGAAVPDGSVKWQATFGGGKVSSETTTTDANGAASILWTVGDRAGFNTLSISALDAITAYHAIATADAPDTLVYVSADSMKVVGGASVLLSVRVTDHLGNGTSGADVTWSATAGQLSLTTTPAGSNGGAATVFTPPSTPGTYTVTASLAGHGSLSFEIVAL